MIAAFFAFTAPLDTKFHTMTSDFVHFDFLNICILVVIVILIDFAFKVTLITSNTYIALLSVFLKQPCILIATVFPHFKRDENKVTTSLIAAINTLTISVMSSSTWPSTAFLLAFMDNFQALNLGDCILLLSVSDLFFYLTGHSNQYDKIKFKTGFRFDEYLPITRMTHSSQMTIRGLLVLSELYSARILSINNLDITKVTRSKSVLYYIFWIMSIKIIYSTISMTILIEHILITSIYFPYYIFNCVSYAITIILLCLKL
ncbi:hypothetical protein GJ496_010874 [Pomphorhynchus laevis]|nr:hypothetical protein GJ496_010874 [Pomphorhynchus laevis]